MERFTDRAFKQAAANLALREQADKLAANLGFGWFATDHAPNVYPDLERAWHRSIETGAALPISILNSDDGFRSSLWQTAWAGRVGGSPAYNRASRLRPPPGSPLMIPNTAPAHVYLGTGQPAAVAAWDDDGHPMIVSPTGLCRADAVPFSNGRGSRARPGEVQELVAMSHMPRASAISGVAGRDTKTNEGEDGSTRCTFVSHRLASTPIE